MSLAHFDLQQFVIAMAVLIIAITIHEFSHAITADRLGDPTPRRQGRISLLPPDHLELVGTIMMIVSSLAGRGIGWGKPVMTNPGNFRKPRRDQAIVAAAGPISNILQAVVFALALRYMVRSLVTPEGTLSPLGDFLQLGMIINLSLAFFNLIPLKPLDGSWIMTALLPYDQAMSYQAWMSRYGAFVLLIVVFIFPQVLTLIIGPPVDAVARLLLRGIAG